MPTWDPAAPGVVELPDGRFVRGRSLRRDEPGGPLPEHGVYLASRPHMEPWPSEWVRWPDFRAPRDADTAIAAIRLAFERAADVRVEIGCRGGTGRTGAAIAILARMAGVPASEAVTWTRTHYRRRAVETPAQRRFVERTPLD